MTAATSITVRVPLKIRRRPGRKTVITPMAQNGNADVVQTRTDPALMKALARAFRYQKLLDEGRYASISEMAAAEKIKRGYLGSLLRLTLLAPALVEALIDGTMKANPTLSKLLEQIPGTWERQETYWSSYDVNLTGIAAPRDDTTIMRASPSTRNS